MASLNKVMLMGNLTKDPELRYTPTGTAVCDLRLAVNRKYNVNGQEKEETCFIDIVVWTKQAESCGKYLTKGSSILIEGRLKNDNWEDKDGNKRSRLRITAERVQFLSSARSSDSNYSNSYQQKSQNSGGFSNQPQQYVSNNQNYRAQQAPQMPEPPPEIFDNDFETEDDIPF